MGIEAEIDALVRVRISEEPQKRGPERAYAKFLRWCLDHDAIPASGGGGGTFYFYPEDMKKVRKYLKKQGYKVVSDA